MHDESKTIKKKNIKTKKKQTKTDASNEKQDKEVEEFKKIISNQTQHAKFTKKIKPVLTSDWLESLKKINFY
jgi:hypothetical protein